MLHRLESLQLPRRWLAVAALIAAHTPPLAAQQPSGIRVIDNPPRRTAPISFVLAATPTLDLGGVKSDPDDEFTPNTGYLRSVRLSDGRHAVIDETRIRFFGATGKPLAVVGRKGAGPQEFQQITSICVTRGDTLVVNDPTNGRITVLSGAGRIVRSVAVGHADLPWGGGCFDDGTFVLVTAAPSRGGDRYMQVTRRQLDGKVVNTLGPFWQSTTNRFLMSPATVVAHGTSLFVGDTRSSEVKVFNVRGALTRVIRSADGIEHLTATEKMALAPAIAPRASNSAANKAFNADQDRIAPKPASWPSYGRIAVDPTGRLWIQSFRKQRTAPHTYAAFSPEGKLIGRLVLPAETPAVAFTAGGVQIHRQDRDGAEHLVTYPLVPPK